MESKASQARYYRGLILKAIYSNREEQLPLMDDVNLWGLLLDIRIEIGQNGVLTLLQDLRERGYVRFKEERNRLTGRKYCQMIEICGAGSDVVERTVVDPAVLIP